MVNRSTSVKLSNHDSDRSDSGVSGRRSLGLKSVQCVALALIAAWSSVGSSFAAPLVLPRVPAFAQPERADGKPIPGQPGRDADYVRVVDVPGERRVRLETSVRTFHKPGSPVVHLVGAMHVGDKAYYDSLQKFLDAQSIVLYEGVKPSGAGEASKLAADDASKAALTERRLRLLATMIEKHRVEHGEYPASLDAMTAALRRPVARVVEGLKVDGWGRAIEYKPVPGEAGADAAEGDAAKSTPKIASFDLLSLGSDGAAAGEGSAKDLAFSQQKRLTKAEIGEKRDGIQVQLAQALGLEFQLLAVDYSHPSWRNSDLSIDEVQARLKDSGASGEALFKMLDGSSFSAKALGWVLSMMKTSPSMQAMGKLMMIEMLSRAEELTNSPSVMGAETSKMMQVIIVDRNKAVLADLAKVLEKEPTTPSVALFYGAGHLPDLERAVTGDMGYVFAGEQWFAGIDMDLSKAGITEAQATQVREMVKKSIEGQVGKKRVPKKY